MSISLLTEDESRAQIRALIESKDWWVIPMLTERALDFCYEIEKRYYTGRASADCELYMGPPVSVMFFRKSRMSAHRLAGLLAPKGKQRSERKESLKERDILFLAEEEDQISEMEEKALLWWHEWVMGRLSVNPGARPRSESDESDDQGTLVDSDTSPLTGA